MTDRFDALLRQHLLGTADERPAEGQLAAIVTHVEATRQRAGLPARLSWWPGRIGPFPTAVLRYGLVAGALLVALVAALILTAGGPLSRGGVQGTWRSTDPGDGSTQTLVVGPGDRPAVEFEDDFASGAACVDDAIKIFRADGTGEISGSRLVVTYPNGGGCGSTVVPLSATYEYREASDTLLDQDGVIWSRLREGQPAVSIPPGTAPPPSRSTVFEGRWTATDFGDASTLTLLVGEGLAPVVQFQDDLATGGACVDDEVKVFRADGVGEIAGNRLVATYPGGGGCGSLTVGIGGRYDYDPDTDTLADQDAVVWTRVPTDGEPLPTLRPVPTALPRPSGTSECDDLTQGGSYTGPVSFPGSGSAASVSLSASVPSSPRIEWLGDPSRFQLTDVCEEDGTIRIVAGTGSQPDDAAFCGSAIGVVSSFADAVALLDTAQGDDIADRIDLEIDGHPAARYDITDLRTCSGFGLWAGTIMGLGESGSWYLVDAGGVLVAIELGYREGTKTRRDLEEARAIVESLRILLGN